MNPLLTFLDAWRRYDLASVRSVLGEACVMIEAQGTMLRGRDAVEQWITDWFDRGGVVHDWQITDQTEAEDVLTAQWVVNVTWQGMKARIDGRTVAHLKDGAITYLRDYTTSTPLGDWDGTWAD